MNRRKNAIWFLRPFFLWFEHRFSRTRELYIRLVRRSISSKLRYLVVFVLIVAAMGVLFLRMPTAYLPDEDQGIMLVQAMLPANSTLEQADEVLSRVRNHFLDNEKEAVESVFTVSGVSFSGRGQNAGLAFVKLRDWDLRSRPDLKVGAVAGRAMGEFSKFEMPWCLPSRRRRWSNWDRPRDSISSCWTAAAWDMPNSWKPVTSYSAWPPRTRS